MQKTLDVYHNIGTSLVQSESDVDQTAERLLKRLEEVELALMKLRREKDAITTALAVAGVRIPANPDAQQFLTQQESEYVARKPFYRMALTDTCLKVLEDHARNHTGYLTKTQVEYLAKRGGYRFSTADSKNSVAVTLRRLASEGKIEAQHARGAAGNKYRQKEQKPVSPSVGLESSETLQNTLELIDRVFQKK